MRRLHHRAVKGQIKERLLTVIARSSVFKCAQGGLQIVGVLRCVVGSRQRRRQAVQLAAHMVGVPGFLGVHAAHPHAFIGLGFQQIVLRQPHQRLTDGRAADAQPGGQFKLGQPLARREFTA